MSPLPAAAPIEPTLSPRIDAAAALKDATASPAATQIDAFRTMLDSAGSMLTANPAAIGRALLSGLNTFSSHEGLFHAQAAQALDPKQAAGSSEAPDALDVSDAQDDAGSAAAPARELSTAQLMQKGEAMTRQSMSVMMQTYSFAVEAQLVTNAATTFTSSINTLIKTQ